MRTAGRRRQVESDAKSKVVVAEFPRDKLKQWLVQQVAPLFKQKTKVGERSTESWWMAERLATLRAVRAARVRFPVRPMISAEKVVLFCNPASGHVLKHCN